MINGLVELRKKLSDTNYIVTRSFKLIKIRLALNWSYMLQNCKCSPLKTFYYASFKKQIFPVFSTSNANILAEKWIKNKRYGRRKLNLQQRPYFQIHAVWKFSKSNFITHKKYRDLWNFIHLTCFSLLNSTKIIGIVSSRFGSSYTVTTFVAFFKSCTFLYNRIFELFAKKKCTNFQINIFITVTTFKLSAQTFFSIQFSSTRTATRT